MMYLPLLHCCAIPHAANLVQLQHHLRQYCILSFQSRENLLFSMDSVFSELGV